MHPFPNNQQIPYSSLEAPQSPSSSSPSGAADASASLTVQQNLPEHGHQSHASPHLSLPTASSFYSSFSPSTLSHALVARSEVVDGPARNVYRQNFNDQQHAYSYWDQLTPSAYRPSLQQHASEPSPAASSSSAHLHSVLLTAPNPNLDNLSNIQPRNVFEATTADGQSTPTSSTPDQVYLQRHVLDSRRPGNILGLSTPSDAVIQHDVQRWNQSSSRTTELLPPPRPQPPLHRFAPSTSLRAKDAQWQALVPARLNASQYEEGRPTETLGIIENANASYRSLETPQPLPNTVTAFISAAKNDLFAILEQNGALSWCSPRLPVVLCQKLWQGQHLSQLLVQEDFQWWQYALEKATATRRRTEFVVRFRRMDGSIAPFDIVMNKAATDVGNRWHSAGMAEPSMGHILVHMRPQLVPVVVPSPPALQAIKSSVASCRLLVSRYGLILSTFGDAQLVLGRQSQPRHGLSLVEVPKLSFLVHIVAQSAITGLVQSVSIPLPHPVTATVQPLVSSPTGTACKLFVTLSTSLSLSSHPVSRKKRGSGPSHERFSGEGADVTNLGDRVASMKIEPTCHLSLQLASLREEYQQLQTRLNQLRQQRTQRQALLGHLGDPHAGPSAVFRPSSSDPYPFFPYSNQQPPHG